ncbi:hypothetical protein PR048_033340 [Dryococelus australis]|uniref:Uncharacterized protein n=1 Tax=Dryococelus australis TaxID=614101 RepID=A0ABQ9G0Y6_9NEOP|nr:hypothetical protein PR048_033340 [Dryococelus australis]
MCFFCDKRSGNGRDLHRVLTKSVDRRIRECVLTTGDSILAAKWAEAGNNYPVFRMPALIAHYTERLDELCLLHNLLIDGVSSSEVHRTRLREKILSHFGDMRPEKFGREYRLVCDSAVGESIRISHESNDEEALATSTIANSIRVRILKSRQQFQGEFSKTCQQEAIDPLLLTFINILLYGSDKINGPPSQPLVTICQLITFYMQTTGKKQSVRHQVDTEPPLPVYLAMKVHAQARKKEIMDMMHIKRIEENKAVFSNFQTEIFTTAAYDNLDYNSSSTTSNESFHGSSISLFQHAAEQGGSTIPRILPFIISSKRVPRLPCEISFVAPAYLPIKEPPLPDIDPVDENIMLSVGTTLEDKYLEGFTWLQTLYLRTQEVTYQDQHFMLRLETNKFQSTNFLHPGQCEVIAMDQPLFALAKTIQWTWPNKYGEDKIFITFGSLHIEQDFLKAIGKYLDGSGWTQMLRAGVANHGTAESLIKVANIAKTRLTHQISAAAFYQLIHLLLLPKNYPDVDSAFKQGLFLGQKSGNEFSGIGLDQAQEQNNALIKGDGGGVGLLTDPAALRRWMLGCPEITQLIAEFEEESNHTFKETLYMHHEQTPGFQNMFAQKLEVENEFSFIDIADDDQVHEQTTEKTEIECDDIFYDGPAVVHIWQPRLENTFGEYSDSLKEHIKSDCAQLGAKRVHTVWDTHDKESIKSHARHMRRDGESHHVTRKGSLPLNRATFLRNADIFAMLAEGIATCPALGSVTVCSTKGSDVLSSNTNFDKAALAPSNHEETHSMIFIHVLDAVVSGCTNICIRTIDTDFVVLGMPLFHELRGQGLKQNVDPIWKPPDCATGSRSVSETIVGTLQVGLPLAVGSKIHILENNSERVLGRQQVKLLYEKRLALKLRSGGKSLDLLPVVYCLSPNSRFPFIVFIGCIPHLSVKCAAGFGGRGLLTRHNSFREEANKSYDEILTHHWQIRESASTAHAGRAQTCGDCNGVLSPSSHGWTGRAVPFALANTLPGSQPTGLFTCGGISRQIRSESPISTTARTPVLLVSVLELTIVVLVHATPETTLYFTAFIIGLFINQWRDELILTNSNVLYRLHVFTIIKDKIEVNHLYTPLQECLSCWFRVATYHYSIGPHHTGRAYCDLRRSSLAGHQPLGSQR